LPIGDGVIRSSAGAGPRGPRSSRTCGDCLSISSTRRLCASGLGYGRTALRRPTVRRSRFVFNPQGLEEFGVHETPEHARLKRIAYGPRPNHPCRPPLAGAADCGLESATPMRPSSPTRAGAHPPHRSRPASPSVPNGKSICVNVIAGAAPNRRRRFDALAPPQPPSGNPKRCPAAP